MATHYIFKLEEGIIYTILDMSVDSDLYGKQVLVELDNDMIVSIPEYYVDKFLNNVEKFNKFREEHGFLVYLGKRGPHMSDNVMFPEVNFSETKCLCNSKCTNCMCNNLPGQVCYRCECTIFRSHNFNNVSYKTLDVENHNDDSTKYLKKSRTRVVHPLEIKYTKLKKFTKIHKVSCKKE